MPIHIKNIGDDLVLVTYSGLINADDIILQYRAYLEHNGIPRYSINDFSQAMITPELLDPSAIRRDDDLADLMRYLVGSENHAACVYIIPEDHPLRTWYIRRYQYLGVLEKLHFVDSIEEARQVIVLLERQQKSGSKR